MRTFRQALVTTVLFLTASFVGFSQSFNGYVLYNKLSSYTTYMLDKNGNVVHSWSCSRPGNYSVLLKDNGNIIRGARQSGNQLNGAAIGGLIQELDPNANVVWEFVYSTSQHVSHHDIALLPNGNVILTAWEVKSQSELIQAGKSNVSKDLWPTHFIEVQQNGSGGQIVWEWHMWDHLIQDYNPSKDNYGNVANNPQLMDINAVTPSGGSGGDWFHVNGVDHNPVLDQLVFSSRFGSEIFVIDHSTTTAEAAGHTGGNSGKGGDFLYRWGNPSNYNSGSQIIPAAVHDPRWIKPGRPMAGYIEFFNNEGASGGNSAVDAINPPLSGFNYSSFLPNSYDWRHNCLTSSTGQSAHDRMSNGNTFVAVSGKYMYEVDSLGNLVWQYNSGPAKAFRYECDHPGVIALLGSDPCGLGVGIEEFDATHVGVFPNPTQGEIYLSSVSEILDTYSVHVYDMYGKKVLETENKDRLDLSSFEDGVYFIHIIANNGKTVVEKVSLIR